MTELRNARISSTKLGCLHERGIMTAWIYLDYDGGGQGFGGYALDQYNGTDRIGTACGCQKIRDLLIALGVDSWEDLPGTIVRVEHTSSKVFRIGHALKDQWFSWEPS